jgi:hypothetical protein
METTPAEREATGADDVTLDWCGQKVTIPASPEDWDINATRAFEEGKWLSAITALVGDGQFATIEKAHRKAHGGRMTNGDMKPLADQIAELYGFEDAGE